MHSFGLAVKIGEDNRNIAAEFPYDLAADAAWGREFFGIDDDGDAGETLLAAGNSFPNGDAFGANRKAVAGGFDITADIYLAAFGLDRGTDLEIGVRSVGSGSREGGGFDQFSVVVHLINNFGCELFANEPAEEFNTDTGLAAFGNDDVGVAF